MLFVYKENKNNDFIQQFILFLVSLHHAFTRVPRHMRVHSSACSILEYRLLHQQHHTHVWMHKDFDTEEKNCWIKLSFLFSFHTKSILVAS